MKPAFCMIVATLVAAVAVLLAHPEWVRIERFDIELAENSTEDLLFQRIKGSLITQMKIYEGRYFWELPLTEVYQLVSRDKRVKKVSVYRDFPSALRLEIEPHTAVLAYLAPDGRLYPVARDATLLPALAAFEASDMPILRGDSFKSELKVREMALDLFAAVPDEGALRKKDISEILYAKDGFKIFVSGPASEVKLGDTDFGPKISRVQKVISYLDSQNIKGRVIDARFSKKVVVRVRNTP